MAKGRRLGDRSLDWIKDTSQGAVISPGPREKGKILAGERSKDSKRGVLKQDVSEKAQLENIDTKKSTPSIMHLSSSKIQRAVKTVPSKTGGMKKTGISKEAIPGIPDSSLTITKGRAKAAQSKTGGKKKTGAAQKVKPSIPRSSAPKIKRAKTAKPKPEEVMKKEEVPPIEKKVKEAVTEREKELVVKTEKKKKTVPAEKVKPSIPDLPFLIVKGAKADRSKTEEVVEKAKSKSTGKFQSLNKVSHKVAGTVGKTIRTEKFDIKKSEGVAVSPFKGPVDTISTIDKKVTTSMKKLVLFTDKYSGENSISQHIKTYDVLVTKSAIKIVDSIVNW